MDTQLKLSGRRYVIRDDARSRVRDVVIGYSIVLEIEDIEDLRPEVERPLLPDRKVLEQRHIHLGDMRLREGVCSGV